VPHDDQQPPALEGLRVHAVGGDGVCVFELNAPDKLNAISGATLDSFLTAAAWVEATSARCVLLRGAGQAFSAGADFASYLDEVDVSRPDSADEFLWRWIAVAQRLRHLSIPTVAAVHGVAYGGGLNIALSCDLVMASRTAKLCQPYIRIGATADVGASWLLPQLVGIAHARRLVLTGEPISGADAFAMGLVAYLVEDDALPAESAALAARIAALDPSAMKMNRDLMRQDVPGSLEQAYQRETRTNHVRVASPEFVRSVARFRRS
jgi:2-(1,2-epoxy-1,2-dihydrophenyl)acetyl-CoA isomerase